MSLQEIVELTLKHAVSTRVIVQNLQTKSYLNGICGTITGHEYITQKYIVKLDAQSLLQCLAGSTARFILMKLPNC